MTGEAELVDVLDRHRFDVDALSRYLSGRVPGFEHGCAVRQFQGGQSNPTFHVTTDAGTYVLRKQPAGKVLPSAHAVDREFRVLQALEGSGVPVPRVWLLCGDRDVIGTMFFVMDHVPGRVYVDRTIPGVDAAHRRAIHDDMARVLARLHQVDIDAVGLDGFGRRGGYVQRQIDRWTQQYRAADLEAEPAMEGLMAWLGAHPAVQDETAIAHGDYRLGNLLIHPTEPRIVAVLDWELSTLGHPLADLAYCTLPWVLPPDLFGTRGLDIPGLPTQAEFVADYARYAGRPVRDLDFFIAFSLFRWAAITAGIVRRAQDGTAADARADEAGAKFRGLARAGLAIAESGGPV